jgi:hypothetical protein
MNKLIAGLLAGLFATATFAADVAQPETPGSEAPKAAAEKKHLAKTHGTTNMAKQPEAQAAGDDKAQAKAEAKHLKKKHGNVNDVADQRLEKDHPNH